MSAGHTPAERAAAALSSSRVMCELLAQCRTYKVPGWWDGSAFRSHPVGLIVDTVKLTNGWHVDNLCTIEITEGAGWDRNVCRDSCAHGDPHPKPVGGTAVLAWRCGSWASTALEASLKPRLMRILTDAAEHIAQASARQHAEEQERARRAAESRAAVECSAIAKATGSAS